MSASGNETEDDQEKLAPLTRAIRQKLRSEIRRTGVTALALLSNDSDRPHSLTVGTVNRWMSGLIKHAPPEQISYVLDKWAALPNSAPKLGPRPRHAAKGSIEIPDEKIAFLRREMERTGATVKAILHSEPAAVPRGLTLRIIRSWLHGQAKSANPEYWTFVCERLAAMPDAEAPAAPRAFGSWRSEYQPIPQETLEAIRALRSETGVSAPDLLHGLPDKPTFLSGQMVNSWLSGQSKRAIPDHIEFVLEAYRALRGESCGDPSGRSKK